MNNGCIKKYAKEIALHYSISAEPINKLITWGFCAFCCLHIWELLFLLCNVVSGRFAMFIRSNLPMIRDWGCWWVSRVLYLSNVISFLFHLFPFCCLLGIWSILFVQLTVFTWYWLKVMHIANWLWNSKRGKWSLSLSLFHWTEFEKLDPPIQICNVMGLSISDKIKLLEAYRKEQLVTELVYLHVPLYCLCKVHPFIPFPGVIISHSFFSSCLQYIIFESLKWIHGDQIYPFCDSSEQFVLCAALWFTELLGNLWHLVVRKERTEVINNLWVSNTKGSQQERCRKTTRLCSRQDKKVWLEAKRE